LLTRVKRSKRHSLKNEKADCKMSRLFYFSLLPMERIA
jgi:hypothetical protein